MRIGVPKEIKSGEARVALTPEGARDLVAAGHDVAIETGAGEGAYLPDSDYVAAGARLTDAAGAWDAELVLKVKEPLESEYPLLRDNVLFTFLHLAADEPLAAALVAAGTTAFSYDTVQLDDGTLPLLTPMSAIAGRLAVLAGGHHLMSPYGGRGVLISGAPGVQGARVVVIGGGVAGSHALAQAVEMGADAVVLDVNEERLAELGELHGTKIRTRLSTPEAAEEEALEADLVIGAVLVPGRRAPVLLSHDALMRMKPGAVLVDIAIDQGGCFEDSHPTTHADPIREVGDVRMYCVTNMPGAVGATATEALTLATLPYVLEIAGGWEQAIKNNSAVARGLNVCGGTVRLPAVASAFPHLPSQPRAVDAQEEG